MNVCSFLHACCDPALVPRCYEDTVSFQCKTDLEKRVPDHSGEVGADHMTAFNACCRTASEQQGFMGCVDLNVPVTGADYSHLSSASSAKTSRRILGSSCCLE